MPFHSDQNLKVRTDMALWLKKKINGLTLNVTKHFCRQRRGFLGVSEVSKLTTNTIKNFTWGIFKYILFLSF